MIRGTQRCDFNFVGVAAHIGLDGPRSDQQKVGAYGGL